MDENCLKKQSDSQFVCKLCDMIQKHPTIVNWNEQGQKMIIFDIDKMEQLVLPQYFRHSNFPSFIRQLNMYDFHKLYKQDKQIGFQNDIFKRVNEKNFHFIQRKKRIKEQQLVSLQFQKKNQNILKKLRKQPKISCQIKIIIQGLLEYKYTVVQNLRKMKVELQVACRQLKDCRSKKISQATKEIKNKLTQEIAEQIRVSKQIDIYMETSFLQERQNQEMMLHMNSQYYLPFFTEDKRTIKQLFFDCNRVRSRHSFVALPSHCPYFSVNSANNSHPLFFSRPKIAQPHQVQKTITKQEQLQDYMQSNSMDRIQSSLVQKIMIQKQNQKNNENRQKDTLKCEVP